MQTRSARFDIAGTHACFSFGGVDTWRILVTVGGVPLSYVVLADPGETDDPLLTTLALRRAGEVGGVRERTVAKLAQRLGAPQPAPPRPTCSVVICTHRRPQFIAAALAAVRSLDPCPDEVIVVDNAPGDRDCRVQVELAGVRYVREDRRGQDWARAAGLAHATCELVAFTDDDVIVSPVWLRPLAELFADESVGAATGVAVGREVETPAQELRESFAGFVPGMRRQNYDWTNLRPVSSGAAGAGANMIFRRELLLELGDAFAPELDGGTPTRSGGDLYALYRVLAAGRRIAFDPRLYAEHRHRAEYEALRETVLGYGTGFSSFLTKVLVERRELPALLTWWWLVNQLVAAVLWERLLPHPGLIELRFDYLRGGFLGPAAWLRSRREQRGRRPTQPAGAPASASGVQAEAAVEASSPGVAPASTAARVTIIDAADPRERNASVRRAASPAAEETLAATEILLFLDPDCVAAPNLAAAHAERHRGERPTEGIVIGHTAWHTRSEGLAAQLTVLWWQEHFNAKRTAAPLTFADMTPSNFSMPRSLFERLGGFDERLSGAAAAHDLAARALAAGIELGYAPGAKVHREVAVRAPATDTRETLAALRRAGRDHALVAMRHPVTLGSLPAVVAPVELGRPSVASRFASAAGRPLLAIGATLADTLEWGRARRAWLALFRRLAGAAYWGSYAAAGGPRRRPPTIDLDVASNEPIAAPGVAAPVIRARLGSHRIGTFVPRYGQWGSSIAEQVLDRMDDEGWRLLARAPVAAPGSELPTDAAIDLRGTLVVYGPANEGGDDRHAAELMAAGARIARAGGLARGHWDAVARLVAEAPEQHVALTLPGVSGGPEWLATARAPLTGHRVAGVFGPGIPSGSLPLPTVLASRQTVRGRYHDLGAASQYAVLSVPYVREIGGIDGAAAKFGMHGPFLDLADRMLDSGFVVAHQEAPGIDPPGVLRPTRSRLAWGNAWARGGLLTRAAAERGPVAGAAFLAGRLVSQPLLLMMQVLTLGEPSLRGVAGTTAGRLSGCLHACVTFRRWHGAQPTGAAPAADPRRDEVVA